MDPLFSDFRVPFNLGSSPAVCFLKSWICEPLGNLWTHANLWAIWGCAVGAALRNPGSAMHRRSSSGRPGGCAQSALRGGRDVHATSTTIWHARVADDELAAVDVDRIVREYCMAQRRRQLITDVEDHMTGSCRCKHVSAAGVAVVRARTVYVFCPRAYLSTLSRAEHMCHLWTRGLCARRYVCTPCRHKNLAVRI